MSASKARSISWFVYILECRDNSLYTGITNNITARIEAHNNGTGARFTRGRTPVRLVYQEACHDHSSALKREIQIKKLPKNKKLELIAGFSS